LLPLFFCIDAFSFQTSAELHFSLGYFPQESDWFGSAMRTRTSAVLGYVCQPSPYRINTRTPFPGHLWLFHG